MTPSSSRIVLGTMRMDPGRYPVEHWAELLLDARSLGVSRLHCSDEYDSFPFLLRVLEEVDRIRPGTSFDFVVKLAEPHFDEPDFDPGRFWSRVDVYRSALRVDRLDCVQWMWRGNLKKENDRLRGFSVASERLTDAVFSSKAAGAVRSFHCFPYTVAFAAAALESPVVDGLTIYRNPLEMEYEPLVHRAADMGKNVLVIRPFKAGDALSAGRAAELIGFSARVPVVDGIVVTCSSKLHLAECVEAAARC